METQPGQAPLDDLVLVQRARRGDHAAFHALVDRHARGLYALAIGLVGHAADAEDLVQETLAAAYRGLAAFRGEAALATWLAAILVRQASAVRRKRARHSAETLGDDVQSRPSGGSDLRMDLAAAIRKLSDEHREVVVLRELRGLSYEEIAAALGVPRGTVESRLYRARQQLQRLLKEHLE